MNVMEHSFANSDLVIEQSPDAARRAKRKRLFLALAGGVAIVGGG